MLINISPYGSKHVSLYYEAYIPIHDTLYPYDMTKLSLRFLFISLCWKVCLLMLVTIYPYGHEHISLRFQVCILMPISIYPYA